MKILIVDKDQWAVNGISSLLTDLEKHEIDAAETYIDAMSKYNNNEYGIVIIDSRTKDANRFLHEMVIINPTQKTITLSQTLSCSDEMGCDFCIKNFNRRRLLKPYKISDIITLVNDFEAVDCANSHRFDS